MSIRRGMGPLGFPPVLVLWILLLAPSPLEAGATSPPRLHSPTPSESGASAAQDPQDPPPQVPDPQEPELQDPELEDPELEAALEAARSLRSPIQELISIYRRIDDLQDIQLRLEDGVMELAGTALSVEARLRAEELAMGVPGVVFVDNRIQVHATLSDRLGPAVDRFQEKGVAFLRLLPVLLVAFLLLGLTVLLAVWAGRPAFPYTRITRNPFAQNLLRQVVRGVVVLTGVLLALDLLAATALVGAVLGTAGVMGLAVGFAFRDIVENYLAGVLLSLRQPFAPNDLVRISGEEGRVVRLTGRETVLMTLDGNHVRIPNAVVFKSILVNLTKNPRRRFVVEVGIAPWEDVRQALRAGRDAVASVPGVLENPRPTARAHELGASSVDLRFTGWVDQTAADFGKVRSEVIRTVKERYETDGIETPAPEFGIRILEGSTLGEGETPVVRPVERPPTRTAARDGEPDPEPVDITPDTTIQEEVDRELAGAREENLLDPRGSNPEPESGVR